MNTKTNINSLLNQISNKPEIKKRIRAYYNNPSEELWDNIFSIVLPVNALTIWQAWIAIDSDAPRNGRRTDINGNIINYWSNWPSKIQLKKALQYALVPTKSPGTLSG